MESIGVSQLQVFEISFVWVVPSSMVGIVIQTMLTPSWEWFRKAILVFNDFIIWKIPYDDLKLSFFQIMT